MLLSSAISSLGAAMGSLLKPGAAPVFRLTPLPRPSLRALLPSAPVFAVTILFGAGRNELKSLKAPPSDLCLFAGGPSSPSSPFPASSWRPGKLTLILCGLDLSTTFRNPGLEDVEFSPTAELGSF